MRFVVWTLLLALTVGAGCATDPWMASRVPLAESVPAEHDALAVAHCAERMEHCCGLMQRLRAASRRHAEFLLPRDQDLLEHTLAEYLACRDELAKIAQRQQGHDAELCRVSQRCQTQYDVSVASLAVEDPVLGRALNQSFFRSDIPQGSCDRIIHELTAAPADLLASDDQKRVGEVIGRRGMLLPDVENQLWHAQPIQLLAASGQAARAQLQRGQNVLITATGRLKNPSAQTLKVTDQQRAQIRSALLPGDILLTYTAGYASNLFVPGNFKHAATFVGTGDDRCRLGFPPERLLAAVSTNHERMARTLAQRSTETGEPADVVESVAEGVILINLDNLLTTRINRLLVLRPRLHDEQRVQQLAEVFSYVGDEFDFAFDLTDASNQVCTEVVYRSLQGRGGIELPLAKYAGRLTLPPDEFLKHFARDGKNQFECVLAVDESPESAGAAKILHQAEAKAWAIRLLGAAK